MMLAGSLERRRATFWHSASVAPSEAASRAARSSASRSTWSDTRVSAGGASSFLVRQVSGRNDASSVASANARTASLVRTRFDDGTAIASERARRALAAATARPADWRNPSTSSFSASPNRPATRVAEARDRARAAASRPFGPEVAALHDIVDHPPTRDPPLRRVRAVAQRRERRQRDRQQLRSGALRFLCFDRDLHHSSTLAIDWLRSVF
jgi:hypothetical protein